jgi:putative transposase
MLRTFKYRAYPKGETEGKAFEWLRLCRWLYNACLEQRIDAYRRCGKSLSSFDQQLELKTLKLEENSPEYKNVGSQVLKDVVRRLDKAYQNFFRRVKQGLEAPGFPKFKGRAFFNSFTFPNASGWQHDGKTLTIKNVGKFRLRGGKPLEGTIKTVTVKFTPTGKWVVLFACDEVPTKPLPRVDREVAIDVGLNRFLTDSDGNTVDNEAPLESSLRRLRVLQRKLSRQQKGSKRREQTRVLIARLHEHIVNKRTDMACKTSLDYAQRFGRIIVEDLSIKKMMQNEIFPGSARGVADVAWGGFFHRLENKCEEFERELIRVDPGFTTRTCSKCGYIHDRPVTSMTFVCPWCGTNIDRPYNSAKNIRAKASPAEHNVDRGVKRAPQNPQPLG